MNVFCISIDSDSRTIPNNAIEWVFNEDDWFRLMNGRMYLLATDKETEAVYESLKRVLHDEDTFFIIRMLSGQNSIGFLPTAAWTWLQKYFPLEVTTPTKD